MLLTCFNRNTIHCCQGFGGPLINERWLNKHQSNLIHSSEGSSGMGCTQDNKDLGYHLDILLSLLKRFWLSLNSQFTRIYMILLGISHNTSYILVITIHLTCLLHIIIVVLIKKHLGWFLVWTPKFTIGQMPSNLEKS